MYKVTGRDMGIIAGVLTGVRGVLRDLAGEGKVYGYWQSKGESIWPVAGVWV